MTNPWFACTACEVSLLNAGHKTSSVDFHTPQQQLMAPQSGSTGLDIYTVGLLPHIHKLCCEAMLHFQSSGLNSGILYGHCHDENGKLQIHIFINKHRLTRNVTFPN